MEDIFFLFLWRIRLDGVYMYRDFVATIIFTININVVIFCIGSESDNWMDL